MVESTNESYSASVDSSLPPAISASQNSQTHGSLGGAGFGSWTTGSETRTTHSESISDMTPEALEAIRRASQSPVGPSGGLHLSPKDGSRPPSLSLAQVESDRIAADKAKARLDAQAEEAEKAEAEKIARQEAQAAAAKARAEALEKERAAEQLRKDHYNCKFDVPECSFSTPYKNVCARD